MLAKNNQYLTIVIAAVLLVASSCTRNQSIFNSTQDPTTYFRPPTMNSLQSGGAFAGGSPTPGMVDCKDDLKFTSDATIPDGTAVSPGSPIDKRWEVINTGNCNWDEKYRLRLVAGQNLGAENEQAIFPARAGSRATIRIIFTAPMEEGTYRTAWQAINPAGQPFGDPIYMQVVVSNSASIEKP